jgi:hypothetical protein
MFTTLIAKQITMVKDCIFIRLQKFIKSDSCFFATAPNFYTYEPFTTMKKLLLTLTFLLYGLFANAQTIYFPDANFKAKLLAASLLF